MCEAGPRLVKSNARDFSAPRQGYSLIELGRNGQIA